MAEDFREEERLQADWDPDLFRRLMGYARPWVWMITLCIGMLGLITAVELARPYLIKVAIDGHLSGWAELDAAGRERAGRALWILAFWLLGLNLAGFGLNYLQRYWLQWTGQQIIYRIRRDVFGHLQRLSLSYFDRNPAGRLVTRVTNDTEALNEMYTSVLVNLFRDLFLLVGTLVVMFRLHWQLTLVSLWLLPVLAVAAYIFQRYSREAWRQVRVRLARINAFLSENIQGMAVIQAFVRERVQLATFDRHNSDYYTATMRQLTIYAIFRPFIGMLSSLSLAVLIWYGGGQVLRGAVSFGVLYAFTEYIRQLFGPVEQLAEKYNLIQSAMASSERIFRLLDTAPEVVDAPDVLPLGRVRGAVAFENVSFAYQGDEWVLKDVSFRVEPGQTVAFVGHTGAGKSSIMNLVARFYDVQQGAVTIDGIDVRRLRQADLRRNLALVLQDVFLFTDDVAGNIRLGEADRIDDAAVAAAARAVGADPWIRQLPGGYREPVVERGATLSHGERQLIAFARALAFDPAILVLDEATASVDSETEQRIQAALRELTAGRTTLIVAHRLSTIQHADQIIVLHKGWVRERGTHSELLARGGLYAKLWELQRAEVFMAAD